MENNENEFQNGTNNENVPSSDPFASVDNAYAQADDPFASVQNNTDNGYTQSNYGAENGFTQATNTGSYVEPMPSSNEGQAFAIAGMVLGIVSLVCCCLGEISLIMAIVGLVLSIISIVKKKPGKGMAVAGIICASLSLVIYIVLFIIGIALGSAISASDLQDFEQLMREIENAKYY